MSILDWLFSNKEWIFSGVGVPVLGCAAYKAREYFQRKNQALAAKDLAINLDQGPTESHFFPKNMVFNLEKLFDDLKKRKISSLQIDEINRLGKSAKIICEGLVTHVSYYEHAKMIHVSVTLNPKRKEKDPPYATFLFGPEQRDVIVPVCIGDWIMVEGGLAIVDLRNYLQITECKMTCLRKGENSFPEDFISEKKQEKITNSE